MWSGRFVWIYMKQYAIKRTTPVSVSVCTFAKLNFSVSTRFVQVRKQGMFNSVI